MISKSFTIIHSQTLQPTSLSPHGEDEMLALKQLNISLFVTAVSEI